MTDTRIVTRNYMLKCMRACKADLCGWVFDGVNYIVKIRLHHNNEVVHVLYKEFPTYLTKKYDQKFDGFLEGETFSEN
jgi:hypothetical protein